MALKISETLVSTINITHLQVWNSADGQYHKHHTSTVGIVPGLPINTLFNDLRARKLDGWLWTVNLPCLILRYISICVKPRHRKRTVIRVPVQAGDSCFLLNVQTASSDPKASYSLGTWGAFPGSEVVRVSRRHSHPSNYNPLFGAPHCLWHEFHLFTSQNCRSRTAFSTNLRIHVY